MGHDREDSQPRISADFDGPNWDERRLRPTPDFIETLHDAADDAPPDLALLLQLSASSLESAWAYADALRESANQVIERERQLRVSLAGLAADWDVDPTGFFVYILWERGVERPLYVGQSRNVLARLGQHLSNPDRKHRIAKVRLIKCADERTMCAHEKDLIEHFQPALNIVGVRRTAAS